MKTAPPFPRVDPKDFFREATLRLCSSLEIERALHQCLLYISQYLPTDQMGFQVYDPDTGVVEIVAHSTLASGRARSEKVPLSPQGRKTIEKRGLDRIRLIRRLGEDPITGPVADPLKAWDLSAIVMDLVLEKTMLGVFSVFSNGRDNFTREHMDLVSLLAKPCAIALTNSLRYRELVNLKEVLADHNRYLKEELNRITGERVIGAGRGLKPVMEMVRQVAPMESPVLLLGETGTGKEVVANAIHNLSLRKDGPFIRVNCGAIPASLLDSELFGYEKGAFTGAVSRMRGRIERAQGGTLFLDEIGELSMEAQIRLLRVLQEKEIDRVGGSETVQVNIRVIAATHRDLDAMMEAGSFRPDLFFRLRVFPISLPPLRGRAGDIPDLVHHFIQKKVREMKRTTTPIPTPGALARLMAYQWPGNVRELENAVERALILEQGDTLSFGEIHSPPDAATTNLPAPYPDTPSGTVSSLALPPLPSLDQAMAAHIRQALVLCRGRVEGERGAAKMLVINPSTLRKRMKKLGVAFGRRVVASASTTDTTVADR